jgi:hypothetical protein
MLPNKGKAMKDTLTALVISAFAVALIVGAIALWIASAQPARPPAPQVGAAGLLLNDDPEFRSVTAWNPRWRHGSAVIDAGTPATYLGSAADRKGYPAGGICLILVGGGPRDGETATVPVAAWHPLPR